MLQILKNIFKLGTQVDYKELLKNGAQLIDVRTETEYETGHIKGSINIPLQKLPHQLQKIKKNFPVITCCASGMRSSLAKNILKSNGFAEIHNGGGWMSLQRKI